jgi:hypothetical protein
MVTARVGHSSAFAKPTGVRKQAIAAATIVLTKHSSRGLGRFVRLLTEADCPSPVVRAQAARRARLRRASFGRDARYAPAQMNRFVSPR